MEKTQSSAQQATGQAPLQFSAEQLHQIHQQFQLQQAFAGNTIQVKQEFPNQQSNGMDRQQLGDPNQVHQVQQMQLIDASSANSQQNPPHSSMGMTQNAQGTTMSTMSPLLQGGQVSADWRQGQVQVVQQPLQNHLMSPFYSSPVLTMPGNLMHPGLGQQQIQVIAAGKPFQSGQLTQQMLTTAQGKPMMSNGTGFSGTYLPTSQSGQTVLFSPVNNIIADAIEKYQY